MFEFTSETSSVNTLLAIVWFYSSLAILSILWIQIRYNVYLKQHILEDLRGQLNQQEEISKQYLDTIDDLMKEKETMTQIPPPLPEREVKELQKELDSFVPEKYIERNYDYDHIPTPESNPPEEEKLEEEKEEDYSDMPPLIPVSEVEAH